MNLQARILLPIVAMLFFLVASFGVISYQTTSESLHEAIIEGMGGEAESMERALSALIAGSEASVVRLANTDRMHGFLREGTDDPAQQEAINKLLAYYAKYFLDFDSFSLLSLDGRVLASSEILSGNEEHSSKQYFLKAKEGHLYIGSPMKNPHSKTSVVPIASPVTKDGVIIGVLYAVLNFDRFFSVSVVPVTLGASGYAFVLGADGLICMHGKQDRILNPGLSSAADLRRLVSQGKGLAEYVDSKGQEIMAYLATEAKTGMVVVIRAEHDDVLASLNDMRNKSIYSVIISIVLGSLVAFMLIRPVVRALLLGVNCAEQIAAGNLRNPMKVTRKDELGKLAESLNSIPESLVRIIGEYKNLSTAIEKGQLDAKGDATKFSGEFAHIVTATNDILSLFLQVVDSLPSPVVVLGGDEKATYLNTAAIRLTGAAYKGKTCNQLFALDDYNTTGNALRKSYDTGTAHSAETRAHVGGNVLDISYSSIPFVDTKGKVNLVLLLITDLTEVKRAQNVIVEVANQAFAISNRVAVASEELSAQVEDVSRGTEVQRSRVRSTATAMEEMNATVLEVARSASQASEQADATREKATTGVRLVEQVGNTINKIDEIAKELQHNMLGLGKQAEDIGSVMSVISDIADQTNLLALNAAIEAARAGEAGRGFAVVADEVRKLAEKTMNATSEVGNSIKAIQDSAGNNIQRVDFAAENVTKATELASVSGGALQEILDLADANAQLICSIATAAEQQSATSEEINYSVDEINRIADATATGMMQSAAAVQETARMAQELKTLLDKLVAQ